MSLPEVLLWRLLRQSDVKFRRQHPIGSYVLDFYCLRPASPLKWMAQFMTQAIGRIVM